MIDEIHLQYPFMGSRRIRTELAKKGHSVNRKRVLRLMRDMGIGAIYPKPKKTLANKAHKVYPYLLRDIEVTYPSQLNLGQRHKGEDQTILSNRSALYPKARAMNPNHWSKEAK